MYKSTKSLSDQIEVVIQIVKSKKLEEEHPFYDNVLKRLDTLLNYLQNGNRTNDELEFRKVKGALRAYLDTALVKGYDDPLVIELDNLETMLNEK
ncbi:hypothetical protein AB1283_04275 [Bacillus sp. S13(2024)]|uniref:hypothetical protein n=1 Tax=unclassified Bacillus (in: firmicutes) TaxID=185979 RepID=UPI003D1EF696